MKYPAIKYWRDLVSGGLLDEVLTQLQKWANQSGTRGYLNDIILYSSNWEGLKKDKALGIINFENEKIERARVVQALLLLIAEIEEEYEEFFQDERKPIGRLDKVNCNRQEAADLFWGRYRKFRRESVCQHYFILSERDQHPHSLVERLILELEVNKKKQVVYQRASKDNMLIDTFNQGVDLEDGKLATIEYLSERFGVEISTLEELTDEPLPIFKRDYVAIPLKIGESEADWKPHTKELLDWFMTDFCAFTKDSPVRFIFLFYYIFGRRFDFC